MQKFLRIFFVFSLLLIFVSNVSGVSMCLDHAKHAKSKVIYKKAPKKRKSLPIPRTTNVSVPFIWTWTIFFFLNLWIWILPLILQMITKCHSQKPFLIAVFLTFSVPELPGNIFRGSLIYTALFLYTDSVVCTVIPWIPVSSRN